MKEKLERLLMKLSKIPLSITIPLFIICVIAIFGIYKNSKVEPKEISYNEFIEMVDNDKVPEIELKLSEPTLTFKDREGTLYKTQNPKSQNFKLMLLEKGVSVEESSGMNASLRALLLTIMQVCVMGGVIIYVYKSTTKSVSEMKVEPEYPTNTLEEIAGNEEAKVDLKHKIDSLVNSKHYKKVGATIPKGILLTGPPGTGKTLMAKALAGESKLPFFSLSGSDFVDTYVGVGAKRIRELFKKAKENAPCILFIDELDSIGGARSGLPGESEREQALNALLVELGKAEGILVIGATNRTDMLDKALIRPGRFDSKVTMNNPTKEDRLKIIAKHLENKKISDDVDSEQLARRTMGLSGADIAGLINEAAIMCARDLREVIEKRDFDEAFIKVLTKGYKSLTKHDERDRVITAWHEAGHALVEKLLTNKEVAEVSIIPTTSGVGGYTMSHSEKETYLTQEDLINEIKSFYGGRAAEQIEAGNPALVTTAASNDLERATQLIKDSLGPYGMGSSGMIDVSQFEGGEKLLIEESIALGKSLYSETLDLLNKNKSLLEEIANELLEKEVLTGDELENIINKKEIQD